ncbi:MAG TPA: hypothetical protein VLH79_07010 [Chthonomonadales bacterium]|nr:hypothetical protein [Chthonomonadales bacterium]
MDRSERAFDRIEVVIGGEPGRGLRTHRGRFLFGGEAVRLPGAGTLPLARTAACDCARFDAWRAYLGILAAAARRTRSLGCASTCGSLPHRASRDRRPSGGSGQGRDLEPFDPAYWGLLLCVAEEALRWLGCLARIAKDARLPRMRAAPDLAWPAETGLSACGGAAPRARVPVGGRADRRKPRRPAASAGRLEAAVAGPANGGERRRAGNRPAGGPGNCADASICGGPDSPRKACGFR